MRSTNPIIYFTLACALIVTTACAQSPQEIEFFETNVRPIFANHCFECHSNTKAFNGLSVDSRESILRGGDSGPAITPNNPDKSLLYQALLHQGDLKMPPETELKAEEKASIRHWIQIGAPWPIAPPSLSQEATRAKAWDEHWAFQPTIKPAVPNVTNSIKCLNPIDNFVLKELESHSLSISPKAERRLLIRRATLDITGLPPTVEQIEHFEKDTSPDAYEQLINRLLESPAYGQHTARRWLDVARYSDTKGYVYAREERFFVQASAYRNWVIDAFNQDLPYDRFLQLQIAADQFDSDNRSALKAMGFLTLGRRFLGVTHDIIDDRIDVLTRGTMGLTVACARCHDHKYDPIPTENYYSLYGIFQNCTESQVELEHPSTQDEAYQSFEKELNARKEKLRERIKSSRAEASKRVRNRLSDYLYAQSELHRYPEEGFDQILTTTDLIPAIVRQWEGYLAKLDRSRDPIFGAWFRFASIPREKFAQESGQALSEVLADTNCHSMIKNALRTPPQSLRDVADRYGGVFRTADEQTGSSENSDVKLIATDDLRKVLYGQNSPCEIPDEEIVSTESFFDSGTCTELWKLQGEVDRWRLKHNFGPSVAVALFDRKSIREPRIFKRGNPANKGDFVSRHFLTRFASISNRPFQNGSGRKELAEAIVDPRNPLTARVWVNRIWQHHFGEGLVRTPSDFGLRAPPPSHPQLLDWLACQLVEKGWSTKAIHRLILNSAAYQQQSTLPKSDSITLELAKKIDPDNRMLWRMTPRRLGLEEMRDSLLAVSQDLDLSQTVNPQDLFGSADTNFRRTIFGLVDRQFLSGTLRIFDFANPDLHIAKRSETSIPQQALFFLNHPFVASRARSLVKRINSSSPTADPSQLVDELFRSILKRMPSSEEKEQSVRFLGEANSKEDVARARESLAWKYGYGEVLPSMGKLQSFHELPHFASSAWQGGPSFPDKKLGWVQLTSTGGHPGNDLKHASVRRWVAPESMLIQIRSIAKHEPKEGDGVRFHILSSRQGLLKSVHLHADQMAIDVESIQVERGETIDFVVDIHQSLNSDQYLWSPEIRSPESCWNASRDFVGPSSPVQSAPEQLAQTLMLSNELIFVD
jgi:hypothetical protein